MAFSSTATNLVPLDSNGIQDVFVRNRPTATTTRVSTGPNAQEADGISGNPAISSNGAFVAFESLATNLVSGDSNAARDVFVFERVTGITRRASVTSTGVQGNGASQRPAISSDGRFVAFESLASNLAPSDTNSTSDIFVRDMTLGSTSHVSLYSSGAQQSNSTRASISGDGRFVAYDSVVGFGDLAVFRRDLIDASTMLVSVPPPGGSQWNAESTDSAISSNGRYVTFHSDAFLLPGDPGFRHAYVRDMTLATSTRVSVDWEGASGNSASTNCSISGDGRLIAFASTASNLVLGDSNSAQDVFVHDAPRGFTFRASLTDAGLQGNGASSSPAMSSDGGSIAFVSTATNLVNGDANGFADVFVTELCAAAVASYCTAGITAHGCVPSISGEGSPSSSASTGFDIVVAGLDGGRYGTIFYGFYPTSVPWAPASPSFKCVASPVQRCGVSDSGGTPGQCDGELRLDFNAWLQAHPGGLGNPFVAGQVFYAQGWFRDPAAPLGTNLSSGLHFALCE